MSTKIIIYGASDLARLVLHYLRTDSEHDVVAFCVDQVYLNTDNFCGLPLISYDEVEIKYPPSAHKAFVAVGLPA